MRVLTVKDGKLVYTTDSSLDYLPANQSYLVVPIGTAETLPVMTEEEYHTPEPILIMGDINRDGKISIADLAALVEILQGRDNVKPYLYDHSIADLDRDGAITLADLTALKNIILERDN